VLIDDALGVRAAVALELRFDPIDRVTIALRALAAIAELRQPLDRVLVVVEREARHHDGDRIIGRAALAVARSLLGGESRAEREKAAAHDRDACGRTHGSFSSARSLARSILTREERCAGAPRRSPHRADR